MSGLTRHLRDRIALQGPLTVAEFMAEALNHPRLGYYMRGDPLGRAGDFVTAPEISQMFGELIGLWCVATWEQMGRPERLVLAELGPGRGTLIADLLRAAAVVPAFRAALEVHLIEPSPAMRRLQAQTLAGEHVAWHTDLDELPSGPLLLVANELFDALPVRQFQRTERGWCERLVDVDRQNGGFRFVLAPGPSPAAALIPPAPLKASPGSVVEVSPAGIGLAHAIGERVREDRGVALVIDYGRETSAPGESLQAVRRHRRHDPLAEPGLADLSVHVDFETLARAAREAGARVCGPVRQADFLRALGIEARAARLARGASPIQRKDVHAALRRLIDPSAMGNLFKVLAIIHPDQPTPAAFEDTP